MRQPPDLAGLQRCFGRAVTGDAESHADLLPLISGAEDAAPRLAVYVHAYRARLLEALMADYPMLRSELGAEEFERVCRDYIDRYPSQTPSLRGFGRWLADDLDAAFPHASRWAETAAFEWAQGEVFDAVDEPSLEMAAIAALAPADWPRMHLLPQAALRRLTLFWNVPQRAAARELGRVLPPAKASRRPVRWLLWRRRLEIHWRVLSPSEAAALDAVRDAASFGDVCTLLMRWIDADVVAVRAAGMLKRWLHDGLLSDFELE